jgi:heme oxygenase (biliverdin-IX-beta and delta-forming)
LRGHANEAIRRHTRHLHDALDSRLVLSNLASRAGYIDYLRINWACVPIEQALERAGISQVLLDWEGRRRRSALVADLDALGVQPPSYIALTIDSDIGSLLGWSYVLEGSRLGARIILQTVMRSAEPELRDAIAFLRHGDGEQLWKSFKVELGKINSEPAAIAKACTGAKAAFHCFATSGFDT